MKLKLINYDVENQLVTCILENTVIEGVVSIVDVTLTDAELTLLSSDWWITEIKQCISNKLGCAVI